jgi:hypothetical protein
MKAETTSTPDEVSSFLGMVTYCSRFIPNATAISEPLGSLTHTKQEWVWKEEPEKAFKNLKKSLCKAVTLSYVDVENQRLSWSMQVHEAKAQS